MSPLGGGKAVMDVMDHLGRAVSDFASYISSLAAQELQLSKTPERGAREILFYLVFRHEQYVAIARALLEGEQSRLVTGSFKQANARAVETNRTDSITSLLARLAAAQAELSERCPVVSGLIIAFKAGGKARSYDHAMGRGRGPHSRAPAQAQASREGAEDRDRARSCATHRGGDGHEKWYHTSMSTYPADPRVDHYIATLPDWQQDICRRVRDLVHAADPDVRETIKRTSRPYFTLDGNICALLAAKDHVNVFIYDPIAPDPEGIINQGQGNATARAIQIRRGEAINERALVRLFQAVIANNRAGGWRKLRSTP